MAARTKADLQKCAVATHGKFQTERSACKITRYLQKLQEGRYSRFRTIRWDSWGLRKTPSCGNVFYRSFCNRNKNEDDLSLLLSSDSGARFTKVVLQVYESGKQNFLLVKHALHSKIC